MSFRLSQHSPKDARRQSEHQEPNRIYFIFAEGEKTEIIYFSALATHKRKRPDVEIRVMDRWAVNKGNSNQYRVTQEVEAYVNQIKDIDESHTGKLTELVEKFEQQTWTVEDLLILSKIIIDLKQLGLITDAEEALVQVKTILTMVDYSEGFDRICIIIDRDLQSFKSFQYDHVLNIADNNEFLLGISAPSFELFLLLHFDDIADLSKEDVFNNRKSGKIRLLERRLKEKCTELSMKFRKNEYDAEWFIDHFDIGYANSLTFEKEVQLLKVRAGTSVFELVKEIIE